MLNPFYGFWKSGNGLFRLLIAVCLLTFVVLPLTGTNFISKLIANFFYTLLLVSGIFSIQIDQKRRRYFLIVCLVLLLINWATAFTDDYASEILNVIFKIIFLGILAWFVLIRVFRAGPITSNRIAGAIAVYVILGLIWAHIFLLSYLLYPGSFTFSQSINIDTDLLFRFIFFSFGTLTTIGGGEIAPAVPLTQSFMILEQLTGILYPIILIGRLVSLQIAKEE